MEEQPTQPTATPSSEENKFPKTMRAMGTFTFDHQNPVSTLKFFPEWPFPLPEGQALAPAQVLVKLSHAAVNPVDYKMNQGLLKWLYTLPFVGGRDGCGVVVGVGSEAAKRFKVGDQVMGFLPGRNPFGTYCEYTIFNQNDLSLVPPTLTQEEAAAMGLVLTTSVQAIQRLGDPTTLLNNAAVLIHGGSSGTGSWGILLAKHYYHAQTIYTTCSAKNFDYVKSLGATRPIDYNSENFVEVIRREQEGRPLTMVYDCVGGYDVMDQSFQLLDSKGFFVTVAVPHQLEENPTVTSALGFGATIGWNKLKSVVSNSPSFYVVSVATDGVTLQTFIDWIAEKGLQKLVPLHRFKLEELAKAHELSISRRTVGKIVIEI